jgi:hypothetical protein
MTVPTQITTHAALAVAQLIQPMLDDLNLVELVEIIADLVQDAEDLVWELVAERSLDGSTVGVQLDAWGVVLGRPRGGLTDAVYERVLLAWQGALRSQGRRDEIIVAIDDIAEPTALEYYDLTMATFSIVLLVSGPPLSAELIAVINEATEAAAPSGVQFEIVVADDTLPFRFDTTGQGLDDGFMGARIY